MLTGLLCSAAVAPWCCRAWTKRQTTRSKRDFLRRQTQSDYQHRRQAAVDETVPQL